MTSTGHPLTTPLARRLLRIDPAAAAASRLCHDRRLRAAWWDALDGLEFVPLAAAPVDPVHRLSLVTAQGPVEACFCAPDLASLAMASSMGSEVPAPLQALAAEAVMQPLIEALGAFGLHDVRVAGLVAMQDRHDEVPSGGWVRMLRHGRPLGSFVCTRAPTELLTGFQQRLEPGRFVSRLARSMALPGHVLLSRRPVRLALLDTIVPGDVLLLASGSDNRVACNVTFGARGGRRWCADATVEDTFLTIQGAGRMIDEDEADAGAALAEGELSSPPRDLEVPVRFEVETAAVPLSQLESMAPGYVIELSAPLAGAPVRLVACGRVLGHAELVAVGDRLGARITHLAPHDAERTRH